MHETKATRDDHALNHERLRATNNNGLIGEEDGLVGSGSLGISVISCIRSNWIEVAVTIGLAAVFCPTPNERCSGAALASDLLLQPV